MKKTRYELNITTTTDIELWAWVKKNAEINRHTIKGEIMIALTMHRQNELGQLKSSSRAPYGSAPGSAGRVGTKIIAAQPEIENPTEDDLFDMDFAKFWKLGYRIHQWKKRTGPIYVKSLAENIHADRGRGVQSLPAWIVDRLGNLVNPEHQWDDAVVVDQKYNADGYDEDGRDRDGYDMYGINSQGFDRSGVFQAAGEPEDYI